MLNLDTGADGGGPPRDFRKNSKRTARNRWALEISIDQDGVCARPAVPNVQLPLGQGHRRPLTSRDVQAIAKRTISVCNRATNTNVTNGSCALSGHITIMMVIAYSVATDEIRLERPDK